MKASELRIGNYVSSGKYNTVEEIIGIEPIKLFTTSGYSNIGEYEPIPLTDEWLKKFGAEENILSIIDDMWIQFMDGEWCICNDNYGFYDIPSIKYVHQLQNIYFALKGGELKMIDET